MHEDTDAATLHFIIRHARVPDALEEDARVRETAHDVAFDHEVLKPPCPGRCFAVLDLDPQLIWAAPVVGDRVMRDDDVAIARPMRPESDAGIGVVFAKTVDDVPGNCHVAHRAVRCSTATIRPQKDAKAEYILNGIVGDVNVLE
jgi:hypothetical protein